MISTLLSFSPLILVTLFIGFVGYLVISDVKKHWHDPNTDKVHKAIS